MCLGPVQNLLAIIRPRTLMFKFKDSPSKQASMWTHTQASHQVCNPFWKKEVQETQSNVVRSSYKTGASAQVEPDATATTKITNLIILSHRFILSEAVWDSIHYEPQVGWTGYPYMAVFFYGLGAADLESQIGDCMIQSSFIQKFTQILPFLAVDHSQQLQQQKQTHPNS